MRAELRAWVFRPLLDVNLEVITNLFEKTRLNHGMLVSNQHWECKHCWESITCVKVFAYNMSARKPPSGLQREIRHCAA